MKLTVDQVLAEAPEVAAAFRLEGKNEGIAQGATAERERIQAVFAQAMPGHDALIKTLAFDGKTSGAEAAVAVLGAERKSREVALQGRRNEAPQPAAFAAAETSAAVQEGEQTVEEQAKAAWDKDADLRAEFGNDFKPYLAYHTAQAEGRVKILGSK
jgi:hypothetical protein